MRLRIFAATLGFVVLSGLVSLGASAAEPVRVTGLRCEYLTDPLGIDVTAPRLSWQILAADPATRGVRQSSFRILVAGDLADLRDGRGTLGDSGRVESDQSTQVVYQGRPLRSRMVCYWKVRVWGQDGKASAWSRPGKWSMGLLEPSDWKAQWIGVASKTKQSDVDPWFRTTFSIPGRSVRATAYVASLGYHELSINGKKVGDRLMAPSISDLSQRVRYVTYDVTEYLLPGNNAVGLWCAPGWASFDRFKVKDKPLVMAQIEIVQADGKTVQIVTDATWKTHPSPLSHLGGWGYGGYGGERYDARLETPGWSRPELDASKWDAAAVFKPTGRPSVNDKDAHWRPADSLALSEAPLRLSAEMVEPNRCLETLRPAAIKQQGPGAFRVDMGQSYAGWFEVRMKGKPGQKVTLQFSERPEEAMSYGQSSEYVFGGGKGDSPIFAETKIGTVPGEGVFCQRFNYAAGRWVTISGLETAPREDDIRGYPISTGYARTGRFECSDAFLNRLYDTTIRTCRCLTVGGYMCDCPHRERMGYGDGYGGSETMMTNFAAGPFYTKWLGDWRDVQRPNGDLPYTAPTYFGGGGPAWSGMCNMVPWQLYLHYADRRILEVSYPSMQRWIAFLDTKTKGHLLLQPWGGIWDFLGDWVPPGKGQNPGQRVDDRSTLLFNNCYYLDNLTTIAKVAELLHKPAEAAAYRAQAASLATVIHREFFHPQTNTYANGTQTYEAFPLLAGVTPAALRPAVMKNLEQEIVVAKKGHIDTGILGTYYLIKLLTRENRSDLVLRMATQKTYPGWGNMLEKGATTLWEQWDGDNSLVHSSFISIGAWFIEGIAGIRLDPSRPGYKHFLVRPGIPADLAWAKGEFNSPYGKIVSDWKVSDGFLTLSVEVPANSSATVYVPSGDPASVTEGGRPAAQSPGVRFAAASDGTAAYEVGSGRYTFRARLTTP